MITIVCPRCWNNKKVACALCEGTGHIPDIQFSTNFTLAEFVNSPTAIARGIPNDPLPEHVFHMQETCVKLLQPMRELVGPLPITSGFRTPMLNQVIGGSSKTSAHMHGWAIDCKPQRMSMVELMHWLWGTSLAFDQAILEPSWIHIGFRQPNTGAQRRQLLANDGHKFTVWTP
jgi:hypothetical protein